MREKKIDLKRFGLSGSTLKMIAVISMLIDHLGAGFLLRMIYSYGNREVMDDVFAVFPFFSDYSVLRTCYTVMRAIGRIAFPIYCFLLVEGVKKTKNAKKYALRLGIFALISEVPFDLCFNGQILEFSYQNVFFTLLAGFVAVAGINWAAQWAVEQSKRREKIWCFIMGGILSGCFAAAGMAAAHFLRTDYGAVGVVCMIVLYLFSFHKVPESIAGAAAFLWEIPAPLAFIPTLLYNGKRGWNLKYFFYLFYPIHLSVIYLLCMIFGLA